MNIKYKIERRFKRNSFPCPCYQCKPYNVVKRLRVQSKISFRKEMHAMWKFIDHKIYLRMADNTMIPLHNVRVN